MENQIDTNIILNKNEFTNLNSNNLIIYLLLRYSSLPISMFKNRKKYKISGKQFMNMSNFDYNNIFELYDDYYINLYKIYYLLINNIKCEM
jgi:hypothetical protein